MAAPSLTPNQQKATVRSKENKKKTIHKSFLLTPYNVSWPVLDSDIRKDVELQIVKVFEEMDVNYCTVPAHLSGKKKVTERQAYLEKMKHDQEYQRKKAYRDQLTIGMNETTRALEKGNLQAVMISRELNTNMKVMYQHMAVLCHVRDCPALSISELVQLLKPVLHMDTISAIGIKKTEAKEADSPVEKLVDIIKCNALPIEVPWLPGKGQDLDEMFSVGGSESNKNDNEETRTETKYSYTKFESKVETSLVKFEEEPKVCDSTDTRVDNQDMVNTMTKDLMSKPDVAGFESLHQGRSNICQSSNPYVLKTDCLCHKKSQFGDGFISLKSVDNNEDSGDEIVYTVTGPQRRRKSLLQDSMEGSGEPNRKKVKKSDFVKMRVAKVDVSQKEKKKKKKKLQFKK